MHDDNFILVGFVLYSQVLSQENSTFFSESLSYIHNIFNLDFQDPNFHSFTA